MQRTTRRSITQLLADYRSKGHAVTSSALVVGSELDPATIANQHIRAHALEGQLFRSALEQALNAHGVRTVILLKRNAYDKATTQLKKSGIEVRQTIQNFSRDTDGPWRAEQKLAALAAWVALCHRLTLAAEEA